MGYLIPLRFISRWEDINLTRIEMVSTERYLRNDLDYVSNLILVLIFCSHIIEIPGIASCIRIRVAD